MAIDAKRRSRQTTILLLVHALVLFLTRSGFADVVPGDVIDKTNWEKAQKLLPETVLDWVKEGKIVLNISEPRYESGNSFPPFVLEAFQTNIGRYALDSDLWIVEADTGERAKRIMGLPFPEIDPDDPKAPQKIMYNNKYLQYSLGGLQGHGHFTFVDRSGYERRLVWAFLNTAMEGHPKCMSRENPDDLLKQQIVVIRTPYDLAGIAAMTWRYRDPDKQDMYFGFVPAIRRVRRSSPANRSDALFKSDFAADDLALYDGKISAMEWKLLGKQEALLPFSDEDPVLIVQNGQGEWQTTEQAKLMIYGFEEEGCQRAPWAPLNWVWAKRLTYILRMTPMDRYYNYGTQVLWIDAEAYSPVYKIINTRNGSYWKTMLKARMAYESADKKMRVTMAGDTITFDDRSQHATIATTTSPTNIITIFSDIDLNYFSLAGFQQFCK